MKTLTNPSEPSPDRTDISEIAYNSMMNPATQAKHGVQVDFDHMSSLIAALLAHAAGTPQCVALALSSSSFATQISLCLHISSCSA